MKFASTFSTAPTPRKAIDEACSDVLKKFGDSKIDLVVVFVTAGWAARYPEMPAAIREKIGASILIGGTGEGLIHSGGEKERPPGLAILAAELPDTHIQVSHITCQHNEEGFHFSGWPGHFPMNMPDDSCLLLFTDPFSFSGDNFLNVIADRYPNIPVVGGIISGAHRPGEHRLFVNDENLHGGALICYLRGPVDLVPLVSQGCRPVGDSYVITGCDNNVIDSLGNQPTSQLLRRIFDEANDADKELLQQGVFAGLAVDESRDVDGRHYIIRNVLGVDPSNGSIALADNPRRGQRMQFHVRDGQSSSNDLRQALNEVKEKPSAAILFNCGGRGSQLYGIPDHDITMFQNWFDDIPLVGFFGNGEYGPVGGSNFMHTFTLSGLLFVPRD